MTDSSLQGVLSSRALFVVAVGKAAAAMASAFVSTPGLDIRRAVAIGTHLGEGLPSAVQWVQSSHPFPDQRSEIASRRALAVATSVSIDDVLVVLLSGGASALMCAPIEGISLEDKVKTSKRMMEAGADIVALNTVRRHLSRVKGGRLAGACAGLTVTLAISDVVGDDLNAIGSGPGVPDPTTWADAAAALDRWGGRHAHPSSVMNVVARGLAGEIADTVKPSDPAAGRMLPRVIGSRRDAMAGATEAAEQRGYRSIAMNEPIVGEARQVAVPWLARALKMTASSSLPACVVSAGETTVRVTGAGKGGRNLEFALALAEPLAQSLQHVAVASAGTDGIDGSSGVAGGMVDNITLERAARLGLEMPMHYLNANDSLAFFEPLDDVIRLGRTDTNVGDLQVLLVEPADFEK